MEEVFAPSVENHVAKLESAYLDAQEEIKQIQSRLEEDKLSTGQLSSLSRRLRQIQKEFYQLVDKIKADLLLDKLKSKNGCTTITYSRIC